MTYVSPESFFLKNFFDALNETKINYAVLRNYETLPDSLNGSDIDVVISQEDFMSFHKILNTTITAYGGKIIAEINSCQVKEVAICGFFKNRWWGCRIDSFSYVGTNGYEILPVEFLLERKFLHNNIAVANKNDSAIISFFKEIIGSGNVSEAYQADAFKVFNSSKNTYEKILIELFGKNAYKQYILFALGGHENNFRHIQKKIRMSHRVQALKNAPCKTVKKITQYFSYKYLRIIKPLGYTIAVLGTDGAGKSTIIKEITAIIDHALHVQHRYEHMRPNLLPNIAQLFGRPVETGTVTDPHNSSSSGFCGSVLRLSYYSSDYLWGWWLKIYPAIVKRPRLCIFDRYYYDYQIDQKRGRIKLPLWIIRLVGIFIPKPDIVLCLGGDPAKIHARKPEISLAEVERQTKELKKLSNQMPNAVWIDTDCDINASTNAAISAIVNKMASRYE